jgi:vancomycin resistance protein YoaR
VFLIPFLFISSSVIWAINYSNKSSQTTFILPNVYIDNIEVGGLNKEGAKSLLNKIYHKKTSFNILFTLDNSKIATVSATDIKYKLPIENVVDQAFLVGRGINFMSRLYQNLALNFGWERYNFVLSPEYDKSFINTYLSELDDSYKVLPQEARFEFNEANNKVEAFQLNKNGFELNTKKALLQIEKEVGEIKQNYKDTIKVNVEKKILYPKLKLNEINSMGIKEQIAEGNSLFAGSTTERVHNIVTGASKLNGIVIKPGETFSFVEKIGDISRSSGFMQAFVISNGRTVLGDGGGICQVSTTLFRAALNSGLEIIERHAHAYRVGYYEQDSDPGLDATIYSPSVDLKFKNNYNNSILIQSFVDTNSAKITFSIYGTKDNRQVEISPVTVWNVSPPPPAEYIDDFSIVEGVVKQVDFANWGASSKFSYKVSKDGTILQESEFVSNFRPWKAIYLVGKKRD